ncbi:MAG: phosphoenolpyruvate synthase [Polyangiaceae bacterium]|jgi:pyruvate,water dikinase
MWIKQLRDVGLSDVPNVGGKNASLGELLRALVPLGVNVPDGFAITADGYRHFVDANGLAAPITDALQGIRKGDVNDLVRRSDRIRELMVRAPMPADLEQEVTQAYEALGRAGGGASVDVAVRSSATAEDLPNASFAGQQETFLNVRGAAAVSEAVRKAFASLFTPRAINYREDMGFEHMRVALSVGVQRMVRSDLASAGVIFTLDTDTGHRGVVLVTSSFGLGESVVQGRVIPDQFVVHKDRLRAGFRPLVRRKLGAKESRLVYDEGGHRAVRTERTPDALRATFSLEDGDVITLAQWALRIEEHYSRVRGEDTPMDIEWAKDGRTGDLFIVQARPETVHSQQSAPMIRMCKLEGEGRAIATGLAIGDSIAVGRARVIRDPSLEAEVQKGDVLVTEVTDPDWEPIMKIASAIVTDRGGRTSHAAIVARELGIPAIVGTGNATVNIADGRSVTVSCAEGETGHVYDGALAFSVEQVNPATLPKPKTQIMLNVGDPDSALKLAMLPCDGVGLARMEFIFASWVGVHPLALTRYMTLPLEVRGAVDARTGGATDKVQYFIDRLSQGIGMLAAAFWPRPVILRFSDFKTNEYSRLVGGAAFEPHEENPMLGWRGASRYYHPNYKEGFLLEVAAVRRVREAFGLTNLKVMIPFCRTPAEGERVLSTMCEGGLVQGQGGVEVYVMAEIPSNILMADDFASLFDGFSIGSNDLTQLTLGVDRDSTTVAPLFDERIEAVKWSCARLIEVAHAHKRKVGICGQAPSDYPDFAAFLVQRGIDSLSLNADAFARTRTRVFEVERTLASAPTLVK